MSVSLEDCWITELTFGRLFRHVVNYVGALHLDAALQKKLNVGCDTARNQCANPAMDAVRERYLQKAPNGAPNFQRVGFFDPPRADGLFLALGASKTSAIEERDIPDLAHSSIRDVFSSGHDRDIRLLNSPYCPKSGSARPTIVALDIGDENGDVIGHVSLPPNLPSYSVCSIAPRGHVRWGKPTPRCGPNGWRNWRDNVSAIRPSICDGSAFLRCSHLQCASERRHCRRFSDFRQAVFREVCLGGEMDGLPGSSITPWIRNER